MPTSTEIHLPRLRTYLIVLVLGLAVVLLLAACGGNGEESTTPDGGTQAATQTPAATPNPSVSEIDACALLSQAEIAEAVGNPVLAGEEYAGPEVCRWDTEQPEQVSVLLTVRPAGSTREQVLCGDLRSSGGSGEPLSGLGDVAVWKFESVVSSFNDGEIETCGPKAYVDLSLSGQRDESVLKEAALAIVRKVLDRL